MAFVLDASIVACWALRDEHATVAERALGRLSSDEAVVPALLWFEVRNILVVNERRKRLTEAATQEFLAQLAALPIRTDVSPDEPEVLRIARKHKLTAYDAAYLELARRLRLPLATLDDDLLAAARREGVRVF